MAKVPEFEEFTFTDDDPLAVEHRAVIAWVEEARQAVKDDLNSVPSGKVIASANPIQARRYVMAALPQVQHWDRQAEAIRLKSERAINLINPHFQPGWSEVWRRRRQVVAVLSTLMKRNLPFEQDDLLKLLSWCNSVAHLHTIPFGAVVRALQKFIADVPLNQETLAAATTFVSKLRASHDKSAKRSATALDQLCASFAAERSDTSITEPPLPPPEPAPAGHPEVLVELKRMSKMLSDDTQAVTTLIGPDRFPLSDSSPLRSDHALLTEFFEEVVGTTDYYLPKLLKFRSGKTLLASIPEQVGYLVLAAAERHAHVLMSESPDYEDQAAHRSQYAAAAVVSQLAPIPLVLTRDCLFDFLFYLSMRPASEQALIARLITRLVDQVAAEAAKSPLTEGERYVLSLLRASFVAGPPLGTPPADVTRLTQLIGDAGNFCLVPGEVWSDAINADFSLLPPSGRRAWADLLAHAITATQSRPSEKWLKTASKLIEQVGAGPLREKLESWLPLVAQGQSVKRLGLYVGHTRGAANTINEENANCLRGLLWMMPLLPEPSELARVINGVAITAYKKVPGVGPRAVKVGNAAVYALSQLGSTEAVGQLAMLKVRVKFGTAQKEIEKAFNVAAEALQLPREQIEEMGIPSYGLEACGVRNEALGEYEARLVVTGSDAEINWFDAKGKQLKSVPAKVKKDHAEDYKDLQQSLKDIQGMLPAQRDRIDGMFLLQKSWSVGDWLQRYLQHPLIGTFARRLIWCVDGVPALFIDEMATDIYGEPIKHGTTAEVTLWHPVGRTIEEVTAWRRRLEQLQIVQPFKQAHREVYLLTDAERNTGTYSNRFAAHVLRQHQFNALCSARGWKNRLRLMVDDTYEPPLKDLPQWGLRAEFWVEGIGADYGTDTNESGVYLRLATDQVRFYRTGAAANSAHAGGGGYTTHARDAGPDNVNTPLPLDQIPALVLSEIMRDVDLFVGVGSVGNDPTWQDGGPEGRFRTYWQDYSFGELSGAATTRKQVLERLVPRLKIASKCALNDRFLVVVGKKRTYKIHLGSGNILMEPNDQYLCIVPDAKARAKQEDMFLPFEGDNTLSIIISKAFLLADDDKIKDPTITRQIDV